MKNHVWSAPRLLRRKTKWFDLKIHQRLWIHELAREEHAAYIKAHSRLPLGKRKNAVIKRVYLRLAERDVRTPYREFRGHAAGMIDRLNNAALRNYPLE